MKQSTHSAEIWKIIKETNKQLKKFSIGMDKLRANQEKTDERIEKMQEKTDERINKMLGASGSRWGKLGENLVKGNLAKRLREEGIDVDTVFTEVRKKDKEFDMIVSNGAEAVIVEVKATLEPSDVLKFKRDMEQFLLLFPEFKGKVIYGAMAFLMKSKRGAESLAEKEGFFVISATGDVIIQNSKTFKPKIFNPAKP